MEQLCIKYVQQTSNPLIPRPRTPGAPSLTIHCRHECQVKNLPDQHIQEANLQRKNEKAEICSGPKGSLRDPHHHHRPVAGEEAKEHLRKNLGAAARAP